MVDKAMDGFDRLRKIPTIFLLTVSIVLAFLLFLPEQTAETLAVNEFREAYRRWIGPSLLLLISVILAQQCLAVGSVFRRKSARQNRLANLHKLTAQEKGYLVPFIIRGATTIHVAVGDGVVASLQRKGIVHLASRSFNILEGSPYNLADSSRIRNARGSVCRGLHAMIPAGA